VPLVVLGLPNASYERDPTRHPFASARLRTEPRASPSSCVTLPVPAGATASTACRARWGTVRSICPMPGLGASQPRSSGRRGNRMMPARIMDGQGERPRATPGEDHVCAVLRPEELWPARRSLPHGVSGDRGLLVGRQSNQARVIVARHTERCPDGGMHPRTHNGKRPAFEAAKRRRQKQPSWPRRTTLGFMRVPGLNWTAGHVSVSHLVRCGPSRRMSAS
jgi:hypothetical protein